VEALVQELSETSQINKHLIQLDFSYVRDCLYMNDFDELETYQKILESIVNFNLFLSNINSS
jgi:hypothetical protein